MSVAANRYARALMDVQYPDGAHEALEQLRRLTALFQEQPDARRILGNPTIAASRRKALLKEIGDAFGFGRVLRNFLNLLVDRNRVDLIDEITAAYQALLDEKLGVVRARVRSARPLDKTQQDQLVQKLQSLTGKQVRMDLTVDPSLIGGVVAQVGSTIYDGSIRQQLHAFKQRLIQD